MGHARNTKSAMNTQRIPAHPEDAVRGLRLFSALVFSKVVILKVIFRRSFSRRFSDHLFRSLKVQDLAPLRMVSELDRGHRVRPRKRGKDREVPALVLDKRLNLYVRAQLKTCSNEEILKVASGRNEI